MIKEIVLKFYKGISFEIDGTGLKKMPLIEGIFKQYCENINRFVPIIVHNNYKYLKKLRELQQLRQTPRSPKIETQWISRRIQ